MAGKIRLSDHFTTGRLLAFVAPCIGTMLFTSIYGMVDGLFISNIEGKTAFAAVNLIMPYPMLLGSAGFMLGTGGSALTAITMGEGDQERAEQYFSLFVLVSVLAGFALGGLGLATLRPVAVLMGAEGELLEIGVRYGRILMLALPAFMLQNLFQSFFATAEKPRLGFGFTVAAGVTNMALDALFVGALRWSVEGAAIATLISQLVGGVLPLAYFARANSSRLRLTKPRCDWSALGKACVNGSSELMTNLSNSFVNILYNAQLIRFAGEDGVSAYGVIMYSAFFFVAVYVGYAFGSAPLVSYHYGAGNRAELHNLYQKSLRLIAGAAAVLTALSILFIPQIARVFVGYDPGLLELTVQGYRLFALSFLLMGFNIYASSFFTALGDGLVSALISFLRTLVFQLAAVLWLPEWLGADGIWLAVVAAEALALAVTAFFLLTKDGKYRYRRA